MSPLITLAVLAGFIQTHGLLLQSPHTRQEVGVLHFKAARGARVGSEVFCAPFTDSLGNHTFDLKGGGEIKCLHFVPAKRWKVPGQRETEVGV